MHHAIIGDDLQVRLEPGRHRSEFIVLNVVSIFENFGKTGKGTVKVRLEALPILTDALNGSVRFVSRYRAGKFCTGVTHTKKREKKENRVDNEACCQ